LNWIRGKGLRGRGMALKLMVFIHLYPVAVETEGLIANGEAMTL
jgi:hypothetical protein